MSSSELFDELVEQWEAADEAKLRQRADGAYRDVVTTLAWQPSLADFAGALEPFGQLDEDDEAEVHRTLREMSIEAIEAARKAEFGLLQFVLESLMRSSPFTLPAPPMPDPSDQDYVRARLTAEFRWRGWQLQLQDCRAHVLSGRNEAAIELLDELTAESGRLTDHERSFVQPDDLLRFQLEVALELAQAHFQLGSLDRAAEHYSSVVNDAEAGGSRGLRWFDESQFWVDGMSGLARVARRRGQPGLAAEIMRTVLNDPRLGPNARLAAHNNYGAALLNSGQPRVALDEFRAARALSPDSGPKSFTIFGEADCLNRLGDREAAYEIYLTQMRAALAASDGVAITQFLERVADGAVALAEPGLLREAYSWACSLDSRPAEILAALAMTAPESPVPARDALAAADAVLTRATQESVVSTKALMLRFAAVRLRIDSRTDSPPTDAERAELDSVVAAVDALADSAIAESRVSEITAAWLSVYGTAIAARAGAPADAFTLHERAKARGFTRALAVARNLYADAVEPSGLRARHHRLCALAQRVEDQGLTDPVRQAEQLRELDSLRSQLSQIESELGDPAFVATQRGAAIHVAELIEVLRTADDSPVAAVSFFCDDRATTAMVIRSDRDDVRMFTSAVGRGELERLAAALRRAHNGSPEEGYPPIRRNQPWLRDLDAWREAAPELLRFADYVTDMDGLVIAPHGPLHSLPLHALPLPDGAPLALRHRVSYTPSLTALRYLLPRTRSRAPRDVYVAGAACREDTAMDLFEDDGALFDDRRWSVTADAGPGAATKSRVIDGVAAADVVHLTSHGAYSAGHAARTGLLFCDGDMRPTRRSDALSPAQRRRTLITIPDLVGNGTSARLVTLRACMSGAQRQENAGDEFTSFSRAFLQAGAEAVITSMWNVDLRSSRALLARMYEEWAGGATLADSLSRAQRAFIESADPVLNHPYHWAPFALAGDWRH